MSKMAEKLGDPAWLVSDKASRSLQVAAWVVAVPMALGFALEATHTSSSYHMGSEEIIASPQNFALFVLFNLVAFAFVFSWLYLFASMFFFWLKVHVAPWHVKVLWLMVLLVWLGGLSPLYYFFVYRKVVRAGTKGAG